LYRYVEVWEKAIPQFNVGHLDTLAEAKKGLADAGCDGLLLGGNYTAVGRRTTLTPPDP
jgi:oxygen-dependent protoporphyrinogen oxidase